MRKGLDDLDIDVGILFPDHLLLFAGVPHIGNTPPPSLMPTTVGWSRNGCRRTTVSTGWLMACPQNPEDSAKEILKARQARPDCRGLPPTAGVNPLWGDRKYDPIFAAAEEADLPVCLHSVTVVSPVFPCQLDQFENHLRGRCCRTPSR